MSGRTTLALLAATLLAASSLLAETNYPPDATKMAPAECKAFQALQAIEVTCWCNEEGHVIEVIFPPRQVPANSLEHLKSFAKLDKVSLVWADSRFLRPLRELKQISSISFSGRPPKQVREDWVVAAEGELTDDGLANVRGLCGLTSLDIGNSSVTDKGLAHLAGLSELRVLRLDGTRITDVGLAQMRGLRKLTHLRMNDTRISGLIHVAQNRKMEWLELRNTSTNDEGISHVAGMLRMQHVDLRGTKVTSLAPLCHMNYLSFLDLGETAVNDTGLAFLRDAQCRGCLSELRLDRTKITDQALQALAGLQLLDTLDLSSTAIGDKGLLGLSCLPYLTHIDTTNSRVTPKGAARYWRRTRVWPFFSEPEPPPKIQKSPPERNPFAPQLPREPRG